MTEPYHITSENIRPENTKEYSILNALRDYHEYLLQTNTLHTQSPDTIKQAEFFLRLKSRELKSAIDSIQQTPLTQDEKYNQCIQKLKEILIPWSPELSTLAKYWCEMMFEIHPFTLNPGHIDTLYKNSQYQQAE